MENVKVIYRVDQNAAVLAGKVHFGNVIEDLDPSTLTDEQRAELVSCGRDAYSGSAYNISGHISGRSVAEESSIWPKISEPSLDSVVQILDARILIKRLREERDAAEAAEEAEENKRLKSIDGEVGETPDAFISGSGVDLKIREDIAHIRTCGKEDIIPNIIELKKTVEERVEETKKSILEEKKAEKKNRWMIFISVQGDSDLLDRFNAGCVSMDYLDDFAREIIFNSVLIECPLYDNLYDSDIEHKNHCCDGNRDGVTKYRGQTLGTYDLKTGKFFKTQYHTDINLDSVQWKNMMKIRGQLLNHCDDDFRLLCCRIVSDKIEIELRKHDAYCEDCDAETSRLGIRVTIHWNSSSFRREFAI